MKYVNVPETTFDALIEGLESALQVCYNVDYYSDDPEKSAQFATGYSKSAIKMTIDNLKYLKSQSK